MKDVYKKILLSKGYRYIEKEDIYWAEKDMFKATFDDKTYYLSNVADPTNITEVYSVKDLEEFKNTLARIRIFCIIEYGAEPRIERFSHIPLAYTETEDGHEVEVFIDLVNYSMFWYYDKLLVERKVYKNIKELVEHELLYLDFDSLVSVNEDWEYADKSEYGICIRDHSKPLSYFDCSQLLSSLSLNGFIQRDFREGYEGNILIYREAKGENPEGWYSESVQSAAEELFRNPKSQRALWEVIESYPGFEPTFLKVSEVNNG